MTARGYLVTGGTGALGRAVVRRLLAGGARVAVAYRRESGWDELRAGIPGDALWGASADLADVEAARRLADAAAAWLGRLDGVAALAGGYAGSGTLEAAPVAEWDEMIRMNLRVTYATCRAALPHLLQSGGGLVTVGARTMETGAAGAAAYAAAKAGVLALTRSLALENRNRRVRVNLIAPGIIDTPANRRAMPQADASRWTPPEAIAEVVAFLLSPASAPVTGAVIPV
jgi:NAD(P)-dependent dehydrogenase (short-subunit alcohol dehydrogenase family)